MPPCAPLAAHCPRTKEKCAILFTYERKPQREQPLPKSPAPRAEMRCPRGMTKSIARNLPMNLSQLTTEQRNPRTLHIDEVPTLELVRLINEEDQRVPQAVAAILPDIARAVDLIAARLAVAADSSTSARAPRDVSASSTPSNARRPTAPIPSASRASSPAARPPSSARRRTQRTARSSARTTSRREASARATSPAASPPPAAHPTSSARCAARAPVAAPPSPSPAASTRPSPASPTSPCSPSPAPKPSRARRA